MKHRDALGQTLHVGQPVNCPDGSTSFVYALGRSLDGESVALVAAAPDAEVTRHLSRRVVAQHQVHR
jgi:hypothetical protein